MSDQNPLCEINNFNEFLEKSLGHKVLEYSLKPLTKAGDNYGSIMQWVEVKVAGANGCNKENVKNSVLHLATKSTVTNPYLVEIFQPDLTFVKEAHFYSDIIPALEFFENTSNVPENERIDAFIPCFGTRISLDPNAKCADADAVVLLENIKVLGFKNIDRFIGLDTDGTLTLIKQLAKFHSLGIATRRLQPNLFSSKIRPFLKTVNIIPENETGMLDSNCYVLSFLDIDAKLRSDIEKQLAVCFEFTKDTRPFSDTPYTTIAHRDLWINNIMIKEDETTKKVIKTKIYDFQLYFYGSFVHDLIFLLLTTVHSDDLLNNFKLFIDHYHTEFVKMLEFVKCPLDDYTFEKMWLEIQNKAKMELLHVLFMSKLALVDAKSADSIDKISIDTFYKKVPPSKTVLTKWKLIIDIFTDNGFI